MPVRRQYVPLYGPIGQCRQHALAPNPYLVYLGGRFCGDERTYPQYPMALASSRTDERHIRDDDPLLSKNRSMEQWPSIYVGRQCNIGATTLGHPCMAPKQPAEMVNKKKVKYLLICVNPQCEHTCIRPLKNHFTKNPKTFLTYFPLLFYFPLLLDLTW